MGIFDCLIDKDNGEPKSDMEYIYRLDMVWGVNKFESKPIKIGTIVNNVIQRENLSYEFTIKETGELCQTNYSWSLAENTPENILRIAKYDEEFIKFKEYGKYIKQLGNEIATLKTNKNK